jgi:hypothetical protein
MIQFFSWLEQLQFSVWVRESDSIWAFPMFLFMHTLGMSIVAGGAAVIDLALLGLWPDVPLRPLERIYPVLIWGFVINAITGVGMFMADATTRAVNIDFYIKMLFVFLGFWLLLLMRKRVFGDPALDNGSVSSHTKMLAWASLFCWFAAIVAGRLIAYVGPVAGL